MHAVGLTGIINTSVALTLESKCGQAKLSNSHCYLPHHTPPLLRLPTLFLGPIHQKPLSALQSFLSASAGT